MRLRRFCYPPVEKDGIERATYDSVATRVLCGDKREHHHRSVADLEKKEDPPPPGEEASFSEKMAHRVATKEGRARYKQRQQTIEPVFGIIKEAIGFRRFGMRGREKSPWSGPWSAPPPPTGDHQNTKYHPGMGVMGGNRPQPMASPGKNPTAFRFGSLPRLRKLKK